MAVEEKLYWSLRLLRRVVRQRFVTMSPCVRNIDFPETIPWKWEAHLEKRGKRIVAKGLWETCPEGLAGPRVVAQAKITTDDVFEQADCRSLDELIHHVAKDGADSKEALISVTDIGEPGLVEEDLLHDEDRDGLGEFRAGFHDAQAERDDLGRE
jgi:hypothetical protein